MISEFRADLRRQLAGERRLSAGVAIRMVATDWGLQALLGYRLGRSLKRASGRWYLWPLVPVGWVIYFLLSRYARYGLGITLELDADIGPGLFIGHFGNIVVRQCHLGHDCSIAQSVHIHPVQDGVRPVVGDRVWIGAHAQICGPYRVGTGSTISAGAVLRKDVPERALCMGNPARVIVRGYDNRDILNVAR